MAKKWFEELSKLVHDDILPSCYVDAYAFLVGDLHKCHIDKMKAKEHLLRVAQLPESQMILFAKFKGEVIAVAQATLIYTAFPSVLINDVVVSPDLRGEGIGRLLVAELEKRATQRWQNVETLGLTSRAERGTGPFYKSLGFRKRQTTVYRKEVAH